MLSSLPHILPPPPWALRFRSDDLDEVRSFIGSTGIAHSRVAQRAQALDRMPPFAAGVSVHLIRDESQQAGSASPNPRFVDRPSDRHGVHQAWQDGAQVVSPVEAALHFGKGSMTVLGELDRVVGARHRLLQLAQYRVDSPVRVQLDAAWSSPPVTVR